MEENSRGKNDLSFHSACTISFDLRLRLSFLYSLEVDTEKTVAVLLCQLPHPTGPSIITEISLPSGMASQIYSSFC